MSAHQQVFEPSLAASCTTILLSLVVSVSCSCFIMFHMIARLLQEASSNVFHRVSRERRTSPPPPVAPSPQPRQAPDQCRHRRHTPPAKPPSRRCIRRYRPLVPHIIQRQTSSVKQCCSHQLSPPCSSLLGSPRRQPFMKNATRPRSQLHQLSTSSKHKDQGQDRVAPGRWSPRPASPTLPALLFPPSKKYRQGLSGSNDQGSCREGGLTRPSALPYRPPALREREGSQPVPVQPNVRDPSSTSSASLSTLRATSLQPLWPAPSKCGFHRNPRGSQNPELPLGRGSSPSSHQPTLQLTSPSEAPSQQG